MDQDTLKQLNEIEASLVCATRNIKEAKKSISEARLANAIFLIDVCASNVRHETNPLLKKLKGLL